MFTNRVTRRLTVAVGCAFFTATASAVELTFTLDPTSTVSVVGEYLGIQLNEQGPGSLETTYSGSFVVDVDDANAPTSINFISGAIFAAETNSYLPAAGGGNGVGDYGDPAPAAYGLYLDAGILGEAYAALRNMEFNVATPDGALAVAGSAFPSTQTFTLTTTDFDFNVNSLLLEDFGTTDASGESGVNESETDSTYTVVAGVATITIPIALTIPIDGGDGSATLDGLFTAMATLMTFDEADFDQDGDVDGDDFLAWQGGFGTASGAMKSDGDYDNDGDVDGDDFLGWQSEFGNGGGNGAPTVPEPSSIVLVAFATFSAGFLARRRSRSRLR